ncbi:AAA family ATPase [Phenylobacterium sp.]|uniref:AAA family ATPase n=1 Tax=Phenylobacterium sp. TaxID=1871053 RepID=UPI0035B20F7C
MSEPTSNALSVEAAAARESIVQSFTLKGLYGYRDVSLSSEYASTILIAKNGAGKTTLLAALYAFLTLKFSRLRDIPFKAIHCRLRGWPNELVLTKEDLESFFDLSDPAFTIKGLQFHDVDPGAVFTYITEEYAKSGTYSPSQTENPIFSAIYRSTSYDFMRAREVIERTRQELFNRHAAISSITSAINECLGDTEIVYLPTYRRIELALQRSKSESSKRARSDGRNHALPSNDIQFGLGDIIDRLQRINETILIDSNIGYREVSANIINELIDGALDSEVEANRSIPNQEELNLFFSRLAQAHHRGPYLDRVAIPNVDKINQRQSQSGNSSSALNYFLNKLHTVIQKTQATEAGIQDFIDACNRYLLTDDASAHAYGTGDGEMLDSGSDWKALRLNRTNLNVSVQTAGRRITLDALSSGEKQMISLFGKMYLYPNDKIVLIDEPELSLSIDWQRRILVDVIRLKQCRQLVAITHSPFVFDNELESFAQALKIQIDPNAPLAPYDEARLEEGDIDG